MRRRRYSDAQILTALDLAKSVSVPYASEQTGVPTNWIYKNLRPSNSTHIADRVRRHKAQKPSAIDAMLKLPAYKKAKSLAELWHANVGHNGLSMRSCLERAADSVGIDKKVFIRAYRKEHFTKK